MRCSEARNLFSVHIDGELSEREQREVTSHLESCHDCAREFARYQASADDLKRDFHAVASSVQAPAELWAGVRAAISDQAPVTAFPTAGRAIAGLSALLDRATEYARRPVAAAVAATAAGVCLVLVLSSLFSCALRQPTIALSRMQTRQLADFTVRVTNDGKVQTGARYRNYVLVLDSRDRWLR